MTCRMCLIYTTTCVSPHWSVRSIGQADTKQSVRRVQGYKTIPCVQNGMIRALFYFVSALLHTFAPRRRSGGAIRSHENLGRNIASTGCNRRYSTPNGVAITCMLRAVGVHRNFLRLLAWGAQNPHPTAHFKMAWKHNNPMGNPIPYTWNRGILYNR